ncbi:hypothetical protein [Jannaschia seosinensis]|uniref:hypothetical protein n=1 Tax=Jannaschia seosinensis TaxID=313367 RepID=UPI001C924D12|nr:hypothetical protein [Jannaschia seosinensis]
MKRAHDRIHGLTDRRPNWPEAGLLAAAIFTEVASRRMPETEQKTKGALDEDEYRAEILRTALPHLLSFEGTDPDLSRLVDLMALNTLIRVVQYPDRRESIRLAFERRARQMHKTWTKRQEAAQKEDAKGAKGSDQKDSDGPPMEELEAAALARATLLGALGPKKGPDCAPDERVEAFFGSIENATDRFPELILFYRVSGLYCRLLAALSTDPKNMIALKEVRDALGGIIAQRRATLSDARLGHNELRLHWTALAAERALELRARIALGEKEEELRYALLDAISEAERMDRGLQARPGGWMRAHLATLQIEASLDFADRAQDHPEKAKDLLRDAAAYGADAARTLGLPASVTDVTAEWEADSTIRTEIVRLLASQWPVARDQPLGDLWIIARALLASSDLPPEDAGKLWSPVDPEEIRRKLCEDLAPGARNRLLSPTPRLADEIGPLLNSLKC